MLTALPTASIIRAALWGFGQLFPFSEFFDNPGQSLIQSAKYLLSWFRIGRYQCPPRKEPQDTRFATSPTCHRIAGCERSVRAVRFPETQVSIVSIALRDQLIHNILVWRAVQRESLTRQGSKAGKIRVRTGRESDRLCWEPEEKRLPCHRPASSTTLLRVLPSSSRQYRGRLRWSNTSCARGSLPLPTRLQPLSLLVTVGPPPVAALAPTLLQQASTMQRPGASRRKDTQPVQAPAKPGGKHRCKRPWDGQPRDGGGCSSGDGECTSPSPRGGPGGESCLILFCSTTGCPNISKRAVSLVSGSQEEDSGEPCITGSLPSFSLFSRQQWVAQEHSSCPFVESAKGCSTRVPTSSRQTQRCHKPQAGFLCSSLQEEEPGECYTANPDPSPPCRHRPGRHRSAPGAGIQACCVTHRCLGHRLGGDTWQCQGYGRVPNCVGIPIASSC